jgi:iron complex transport system substrate-binding protein
VAIGPALIALLVMVACGGARTDRSFAAAAAADGTAGNVREGCAQASDAHESDARADYFPDKLTVDDARNFSIEYHGSYKVVTVRETFRGGPSERYVLVQCGTPRPRLDGARAAAAVVTVPIGSLFSLSTTHLPLLVDLDRLRVLTGVAKIDSIVSQPVLDRIHQGGVTEIAPLGVIDSERVVARHPSVLMTGGADSPAFVAIRAAGVPVVANAEWLEPTALGRAEWVKFLAVFLNEERSADRAFRRVKDRYRELVDRTSAIPVPSRPLVITGRASRGMFTIAGGQSYVARLIEDAGGRYAWADNTSTATTTVDLEAQLHRASHAAFWINGGGWKNRADMLADEPRYAAFDAYRRGQVWVYERLQNAAGGNDYWSRSVTRPDLLLADLVKIFHPDLVPEHELTWYIQVPAT